VAQSWRALAHAPSETAGLEWGAFALAEIGKSAGRELADADRLPDTIMILKIGRWVLMQLEEGESCVKSGMRWKGCKGGKIICMTCMKRWM
jgi:hypothetical protein